jgi:hypothetical protein
MIDTVSARCRPLRARADKLLSESSRELMRRRQINAMIHELAEASRRQLSEHQRAPS